MRKALFTAAVGALLATAAQADVIVGAYHQGWYDDSGLNSPTNYNYIAGKIGGVNTFHDFFVFSLSGVSGSATGATLRLYNPDYTSADAFEVYSAFDVTTPISTLNTGAGGTAVYTDLGSGTAYGAQVVTDATDGTWVDIPLNTDALATINAAIGSGDLAIGGAVVTLTLPALDDEYVFGFSDAGGAQLVLTGSAVPEPASLGLVLVGGLLALRRSRA